MKRQLNTLHWPYIAPVILDENKTVAVVAESIVCAERHKAYGFVLQSVFEMAPGRPKSEVKIIASDCFVTQSLLSGLGIDSTCHLMWDHYHILEVVWPTKLGPVFFGENCHLLMQLLNAHSKPIFDSAMGELRSKPWYPA